MEGWDISRRYDSVRGGFEFTYGQCLSAASARLFYPAFRCSGRQTEPLLTGFYKICQGTGFRVSVILEGREVYLRAWQYQSRDRRGILSQSFSWIQTFQKIPSMTGNCALPYGGDDRYRICQEWLLGAGGVKMLRALVILPFEPSTWMKGMRLSWLAAAGRRTPKVRPAYSFCDEVDAVRAKCIFTTHTPRTGRTWPVPWI